MTTSKIVVDARQLVVIGSNGVTLTTVRYTEDPTDAVAALTLRIGEAPTVSRHPQAFCTDAYTTAAWGKALILTWSTSLPVDSPTGFFVDSNAPAIDGTVRVETPAGFAVGDDVHAMIRGTKDTVVQGDGDTTLAGHIRVFYSVDKDKNAAQAYSDTSGHLIVNLYAPANVDEDC